MNSALEYTTPENRGKCGFCGKEEGGYAKQDAKGVWQAACWNCVKPTGVAASQPKRKPVGTQITEEDEMARTDGRVKCNTKGCRNYIAPPATTCKTCRTASAQSAEVAKRPADVGAVAPEHTDVQAAFSSAGNAALAESIRLDDAAKPGDTYQDPVPGVVFTTPAPAKPIDAAAQVIIPGVPARSATAEAKRKEEISKPDYVALFEKALAARPKKTCAQGHDMTDINNAHIGDLRRTGKITCDPCNRIAQAGLASRKAQKAAPAPAVVEL